ncbi:spore germination protein [Bacillus sp. Bva_UNVM-123]|uniref:spore germination protein n=1 Tax=Bacillus sp. Bva_UNVM-123 TaxID=2829798 RepID=UPI00391EE7C6
MFLDLLRKKLKQKDLYHYDEKSNAKEIEIKKQQIGSNIHHTISIFEEIYSIPNNNDVNIREFNISSLNKKAAILAITSITDSNAIDKYVLVPLLTNKDSSKNIVDILEISDVSTFHIIEDIINKINDGNAVLFVDGLTSAYCVSVSDFQNRDIASSENEIVIKGPKEAFTENLTANISLIRKRIRNEKLVIESTLISKRSHNKIHVVYIKDLVNKQLLTNIKTRINNLDVDSIQNIPLLEQLIEDRQVSIFPTILYTERPDRAVSFLEDGYIVLLMENSPASLVLPATFWSFFHAPEDHYMRYIYAIFTRALRILAIFITLFTGAIYVGLTNYHTEMIPPDLLLAVASTRDKVPFPAFVEVFLMEIAFELIREGGLRVPTPIGPTIGIVGALILGQAAVQANIVSPIVVIVVALSGLSSFVIGDISMNFAVRLCRFLFLLSSALFGFYGMAATFTAGVFYLVSIKSFGVPYLSPMTPNYISSKDTLFRIRLTKEMFRPGYLKQKDIKKN